MFTARFDRWQSDSPLGRLATRWTGRPAWVWGLALLVAVPFVAAIAVVAMGAMIAAAAVYVLLSAVHELFVRVRSALGYDGQGRRNVRVRPGPGAST